MLLTEMFGHPLSGVKYTDRNAPDIMDRVMTPDGSGIIVDSSQNNDGYYVFFKVDLDDSDGQVKTYHIKDVKKIES